MIATYKNVFTGDEFMRELGRIVVSICQFVFDLQSRKV